MAIRMNREAYEELIRQNLEWLRRQPCSLEKDHIAVVLEASVESEYDLRARVAKLEAALLAPTHWESNGEAGDGQTVCSGCGEDTEEPHTWQQCADNIGRQRDGLYTHLADLEAERDALQRRVEFQTDWYQQRFDALRKWVNREVAPLSEEVRRRYYAICANGSPAPHESADWSETMHSLKVRLAQAKQVEADRDRLREVVRDVLSQMADRERFVAHGMRMFAPIERALRAALEEG